MWDEYRRKLKEMTAAAELATLNCQLAESFAKDAERHSAEVLSKLDEALILLKTIKV